MSYITIKCDIALRGLNEETKKCVCVFVVMDPIKTLLLYVMMQNRENVNKCCKYFTLKLVKLLGHLQLDIVVAFHSFAVVAHYIPPHTDRFVVYYNPVLLELMGRRL
jgi:hypothetical protein